MAAACAPGRIETDDAGAIASEAGATDDGGSFDGPDSAIATLSDRSCNGDGWCWENPTPHGLSIDGMWGFDAQSVLAVGEQGTILHYDGKAWSSFAATETYETLEAVWGASPNDVWTVGTAGVILRFDGLAWHSVASPTTSSLHAVWGVAANDVWAVGDALSLLHFDGTAWSLAAPVDSDGSVSLRAVWASSASDVWIGGAASAQAPFIAHFNGTSWARSTLPPSPASGFPKALWGTSPTDVWAAWGDGVVRFDGASWAPFGAVGFPTPDRRAIWGTARNDVWTAGAPADWHGGVSHASDYDGDGGWLAIDSTARDLVFNAGWSASPTQTWVGGELGTLLASNGAPPTEDPSDAGNAWSLGTKSATRDEIFSLWGSGPSDVWAAGGQSSVSFDPTQSHATLLHFDGLGWSPAAMPAGAGSPVRSVWGAARDDVWAVEQAGTIFHFDGAAWSTALPDAFVGGAAVWGRSATDVWAVGWAFGGGYDAGAGHAKAVHWDGTTWTTIWIPAYAATSVWGASASDVYVVAGPSGGSGIIFHWDGVSFGQGVVLDGSVKACSLHRVWGAASDDVWVLGYGENSTDCLFHFDGAAWSRVNRDVAPPSPAGFIGDDTTDIFGTSKSDVWTVSNTGSAQHWDGVAWKRSTVGPPVDRIFESTNGDVWAAGRNGAILRHK